MKPKLVIVLGPTAVGKSDVAIDLALKFDAEIINADSQQVYRHMNIGTGKPGPEQRSRVAHHLIDVVDPDAEFNVALFRRMALECAEDIRSRGKQVIVSGGTGLYLKALTEGLFVGPPKDDAIRQRLGEEADKQGVAALYARLMEADPMIVGRIHPNDRYRIIRALEVYELTGKGITQWQGEHGFQDRLFDTLKIGLNRDREELYDLINRRCAEMVERGLVDEVQSLQESGYSLDLPALQSIGYRHMGLYLRGDVSLEEAVVLMQRDTRHLAKRQLTWFRADKEVRWFHPERDREQVVRATKSWLDRPK